MPKVRIEKRQLAKLREQWQIAAKESIAKRSKMMTTLKRECHQKFDDLGQRIFKKLIDRLEVVEDSPADDNVEYEPEDLQLQARVEELHKQLGEAAAKVAKHRKEVPEQVRQHFKKQLAETHPRLDPMPDEREAQTIDPKVDLSATLHKLESALETLDKSLSNVKQTLPVAVDRGTRVVKVIEEDRKRKRT